MLDQPTAPEAKPEAACYWLQDQPPDLDAGDDAFAVSPLVDRLVDLVKASPAPFTLSLSGSWGIGKSTVAETLIKRVRLGPNAMKACLVDAWSEDIEHLRRTLAIAVGAELLGGEQHREAAAQAIDAPVGLTRGVSKPTAEFVLPQRLKDIPRRLEPLVAGILLVEVLVIIGLLLAANEDLKAFVPVVTALLGASLTAVVLKTDVVFRVETTTESQAPAEESVHMAREFAAAVTGGNAESKERVLVVVDNLDRLPGADALRALAEIRSLVEIKGSRCVFLIPVDRAAFAGHIQSALSLDDLSAKDYLDKFFNLDVLLTQPEPLDVRDWATEQARPLFGEEVSDEELAAAVQTVASMAGGSPRAVKRIINGVSTRLRMLDESVAPRPTLAQLALIEGLIVRFPEIVAWLESEPKSLSVVRAALAEASGPEMQDKALADVPGITEQRRRALRTALIRNTDIAMPPGLIRLAMALREDRAWKGIPDPQALREALEDGESRAYSDALDAIDEELRATAMARSVAWIERSIPAFPRDAMTNLIAIAGGIRFYPTAADTLRPLAVKVVLLADPVNLNRTSPLLADFLLDPSHATVRRSEVVSAFVGLIAHADGNDYGPFEAGVLVALRLGSSEILRGGRLKEVQVRLAALSDDELSEFWEPEVNLILVSGPITKGYAKRLAEHEIDGGGDPLFDLVLDRMTRFVEAGGVEPSLALVTPEVTKQLGASTAVLTPEALGYLQRLPGVLANTTGDEVDAVAGDLVASTRGTRGDLLAIALRLKVTPPVRTTVITATVAWLATPSLDVDDARKLLTAHGQTLKGEGVDYVSPLIDQWITRGIQGFGALAVEFAPAEAPAAMLASLASGVSGAGYTDRIAEAATLIGSDGNSHLTSLVAQVATWVTTTGTPATLTALGTALLVLQTASVDCSPINAALQTRLEGAGLAAPELLAFARVVIAWDEQGVRISAKLLASVASRLAAVGASDAEVAPWAARKTKGSATARLLMVATVKDAAIPVGKVVAAAAATHGVFRQHEAMTAALVARAAVEVDLGDTRRLLEEARRWKRPRSGRAEFEMNLSSISSAKPEMDALVNDLRT